MDAKTMIEATLNLSVLSVPVLVDMYILYRDNNDREVANEFLREIMARPLCENDSENDTQ